MDMKMLLVLSFFLASCESSNQNDNLGDILARISFGGSCTDLEAPSKNKPVDIYEVRGLFSLLENDSFGFISVTPDEMKKRFDTEVTDNLDEWMAIIDIPEIDIYKFPFLTRSLRVNFCTFPVDVFGISSNINFRGNLKEAILSLHH